MDIQKEREAFEAWAKEETGLRLDVESDGNYDSALTFFAWEAWQAAKNQAVPEGFVVVPKEPTEAMHQAGQNIVTFGGGYDDIYGAMIEAQEPK